MFLSGIHFVVMPVDEQTVRLVTYLADANELNFDDFYWVEGKIGDRIPEWFLKRLRTELIEDLSLHDMETFPAPGQIKSTRCRLLKTYRPWEWPPEEPLHEVDARITKRLRDTLESKTNV